MAIKLGGSSTSQINEVVTLNNDAEYRYVGRWTCVPERRWCLGDRPQRIS